MKHNNSIDFVKCIAIFFIVCIHIHPFNNMFIGDLLITFSRFAVPFFFVVSGYLLREKLNLTKDKNAYFIKYILKNIKLYFFWLIVYLLYDICIIILKGYINNLSIKNELINYVNDYSLVNVFYLGSDTTSYPLWFLLALIWSTVIVFLFYKFNKIGTLLLVSILLNLIGLLGQSYNFLFNIHVDTKDAFFFGLFYISLGFYISNHYDFIAKKINLSIKHIVLLIIAFSLAQIIEMYILTDKFLGRDGNYYLSTIPLTCFIILAVLKTPNISHNKYMLNIGRNSVGIFVMHNLLINIVYLFISITGIVFIKETLFWQFLFTPFVFIFSFYLYNLINRLRVIFIRKFIPETI